MTDSLFLPKFAQDPQKAVKEELKTFESGPLKSRLDELESNPSYCPHKICNTSWAGRTIAVCCETCQVISPSYLCVPCFLNGNHVGHKYYITYVTTSSCSCGNPHKIKPSGFCSRHHIPSPNPHIDDFGEELSQIPIKIFSEAIESLTFLSAFDCDGLKIVIEFLLSIATKSDALMRCLEIAICEKNDLSLFLIDSAAFSFNSMRVLSQFFYNFFNDDFFALNFGYAIMKAIIPFTKIMINYDVKMAFGNIMPPHHHVFEFMFSNYAFIRPQTTNFILSKNCDVVNIIRTSILQFQRAIDANWNFAKVKMMFFHQFLFFFSDIIRSLPDEKGKEMHDALLPIFGKWEFSHPFKRVFGNKADDPSKEQELAFEMTNGVLLIYEALKLTVIYNLDEYIKFWFGLNVKSLKLENSSNLIECVSKSTLNDAEISSFQTLSIIFELILISIENTKDFVHSVLKSNNISLRKFILVTVTMPIRLFSFAAHSYFGLFIRNDDSTLATAQKFYYKQSIMKRLFPLFSLIQLYAGLYIDKNEFLRLIMSIYGIFVDLDDKQNESDKIFSIIYFISCIIFDRIIMTGDMEEFRRLLIISVLQEKPQTVVNLNKLLWEQITTVPTYIAELGNITTRVKGEEYSLLKVKPNAKWSVIQPWKPPSEIMKMIGNFIQKHEDTLAPFNDWSDEPKEINLRLMLLTKNMYALEYRALSDFMDDPSMNKATIHLVLNIILQTHRIFTSKDFATYAEKSKEMDEHPNKDDTYNSEVYNNIYQSTKPESTNKDDNLSANNNNNDNDNIKSATEQNDNERSSQLNDNNDNNTKSEDAATENEEDKDKNDGGVIEASCMAELMERVPYNFEVFLNTPISYSHRPPCSLIDMMKKVGSLANPVLEELGISPVLSHTSDAKSKERRDKAKQLKLSIMAEFRNQQNMFNGSKADLAESEECSVCRVNSNDSILCYPAIVHKTGLPSFIQTGNFKQTYFVNICTHLVHASCAKNEMNESMYRCPIDRSMYNFFIPKISTGYTVIKQSTSENKIENHKTNNKNIENNITENHDANNSNNNNNGENKGIENHNSNGIIENQDANNDNNGESNGINIHNSNNNIEIQDACNNSNDEGSCDDEAAVSLFFKAMEIINENFGLLKQSIHPATIIAGHLVIAEARYRNWPDSLDKPVFAVFMSNFFLNAWHFIRMQNAAKEETQDESKTASIDESSHIERLVLHFLEGPAPFVEGDVCAAIKKLAEGLRGSELLIFLRQAAILQHFCLAVDLSPNSQFIDWESFLSFKSLCERYSIEATQDEPENATNNDDINNNNDNNNGNNNNNINNDNNDNNNNDNLNNNNNINDNGNDNDIVNNNNNDDGNEIDIKGTNSMELPIFSLVHLPNNFLEFTLPPYSLNLAETSSLTALCLLTNTVISISKTTASSPYISLSAHLNKLGGTSLLLLLNGPFSTSIAVASNEFSFVVKIISPYINDYGDEDPGYVTGRVLTLSHERLERAYDIYLSGEWTKFIPK